MPHLAEDSEHKVSRPLMSFLIKYLSKSRHSIDRIILIIKLLPHLTDVLCQSNTEEQGSLLKINNTIPRHHPQNSDKTQKDQGTFNSLKALHHTAAIEQVAFLSKQKFLGKLDI